MNDRWDLAHEAIRASFSLAATVIALLVGWLVGHRLTYVWNVRQKRREFQFAASQQFYAAYGEFFAIWKLWNRLDRGDPDYAARQWELHKRAALAEANIEGLLVKLSSELKLKDHLQLLACFRQAFQQLRQSIRSGEFLPWPRSEHPEYLAFKVLATGIAGLLAGEWEGRVPSHWEAASQLREITANHWEKDWVRYSVDRWAGC